MPSCFLVLQRFFLRVDDVLFRVNDTRLYHEFGNDYFVREYTSKEVHYNVIRQVKKKKRYTYIYIIYTLKKIQQR